MDHIGELFAIAQTHAIYRQLPMAVIRNTSGAPVSLSTWPTVPCRSWPTAESRTRYKEPLVCLMSSFGYDLGRRPKHLQNAKRILTLCKHKANDQKNGRKSSIMQPPNYIPTRAWSTTEVVAENITIYKNLPFAYLDHIAEHFAIAQTHAIYRQLHIAEIRTTCDAPVGLSTWPTVSRVCVSFHGHWTSHCLLKERLTTWPSAKTFANKKYNQKYYVAPVPSCLYLGANVRKHHREQKLNKCASYQHPTFPVAGRTD